MARRYHINPDTGRPNICRAQTPERCEYAKGEDIPEHYDTKEGAREAYAKSMSGSLVNTTSSASQIPYDPMRLKSLRYVGALSDASWAPIIGSYESWDYLEALAKKDADMLDSAIASTIGSLNQTMEEKALRSPEVRRYVRIAQRDNGEDRGAPFVVSDGEQTVLESTYSAFGTTLGSGDVTNGEDLAARHVPGVVESALRGNRFEMTERAFNFTCTAYNHTPGNARETRKNLAKEYHRIREQFVKLWDEDYVSEKERELELEIPPAGEK